MGEPRHNSIGARGDRDSAALLRDLINRVRDGRTIEDLLAPDAGAESIAEQLRSLSWDLLSIDSINGNALRTDACISNGSDEARIVLAHDNEGLLKWLHVYVRPTMFTGVPRGRVIVFNGPSGAGKSTLMRSLQAVAAFPLVVLDEPEHIGTVQPGYLIWRDTAPALHRGYLAAIQALATAGNIVALSAAGHPNEELTEAFSETDLIRIGLRCDLNVLIEREQRTGRWAGIAQASLNDHDGWTYDLEFDTTSCPDPVAFARRVLALIDR